MGRNRKLDDAALTKIVELYVKHKMSCAAIGERFGVAATHVAKKLKEQGVTTDGGKNGLRRSW